MCAYVVSVHIVGTVLIRLGMFPLVILGQRNAAEMHNHMPTMQRLQQRMSEARRAGDMLGCLYLSVLLCSSSAHYIFYSLCLPHMYTNL